MLDAILYVKMSSYATLMSRYSPASHVGSTRASHDDSGDLLKTKVQISACLFLAQKVNDTECAKIRDVINAVWTTTASDPEELKDVDEDNQIMQDLRKINLSYQEYPQIRQMLIFEEQTLVRCLGFDFSRRAEKMLLRLLEMAEAARMSRPD